MALSLAEKQQIVSEVAAVAATAHSAVAAEYRGLTVETLTELRARARSEQVYLRVVKNTLARRAVAGTAFECMQSGFTGPLILAFSREDPGAAARLVKDFASQHDQLRTRLVAVGGQLMDASALERLASLPTREQALSQLLAVMQAPMAKLVGILAAPHAKLVRTLAALRDRKQAAG
ncbi:MAG: 50S ribosomal protein L10 [Gammaproteobacteria bacterium]